jgi:hypothetical protein
MFFGDCAKIAISFNPVRHRSFEETAIRRASGSRRHATDSTGAAWKRRHAAHFTCRALQLSPAAARTMSASNGTKLPLLDSVETVSGA